MVGHRFEITIDYRFTNMHVITMVRDGGGGGGGGRK